MMMQISSAATLPAHKLQFQTRCPSFRCQTSSVKPSSSTIDSTRLHLSNLDKLLDKQNPQVPATQLRHHFQQQPIINNEKGKSFLENLNLARLWPEMKATDDMSPRHLQRLQRLLSKTAEYSPRNVIGSRWMEYHGSNDWKGMLDPLDENLRREVIRYGELVQAAYHAFHSDPAMSQTEPPPPQTRPVALPDTSYRVTKSLYATSSIGLPKWVDDVAPDLGWMTQRSSWIGYVAVCDDRREIARMGRRDIVISLRGTSTCLEWAENMRAQLIDIDNNDSEAQDHGKPKVECGFLSLFRTRGAHVPSLAESVVEEVKRLMELYKGEELSITVTGHSLGATLALLVADEISTCMPRVPPVSVFSFGGPRVGNKAFGNRITAQNVKVLRIVNSQDVITRVPGIFISEELEQKIRTSKVGRVMENTPMAYSHVGAELRVDTKMSPFLKPDADMACCHDLEAYLHLVDGFLASNCPFRANAKRSLARLMQDQGSNVKSYILARQKPWLLVSRGRDPCLCLLVCLVHLKLIKLKCEYKQCYLCTTCVMLCL